MSGFDDPEKRGPGRPRKLSLGGLDAAQMDKEIAAEARQRAAALHTPMSTGLHGARMSDEEIMATYERAETSVFDVPEEEVPDGFVYQWHRTEVFGQPDLKSVTNAERNGWRAVPASRHPGRWMPMGYEGPVEVEGQRLMELPETEAYNRARYLYLKAKSQKQSGQEMLGRAPQGTGPRSHPQVRPTVRTTFEQLPVET